MKNAQIATLIISVLCIVGNCDNVLGQHVVNGPLSTTDVASDETGEYLFLLQKTAKRLDLLSREDYQMNHRWFFNDEPTGVVVKDGRAYVTSSYATGLVTVIDILSKEKIIEINVPMGATSPVLSHDGAKLYVCCQYDNSLAEIDLISNKVKRNVSLLREPVGAVLSNDGKYLYVTNFLPAQRADVEVVTAKVSVVDTKTMKRVKDIALANGSNALRGICISSDGRYIFITHNLGRFQVPTSQLQQGWMNTSGLSIIHTASQSYLGTVLLDEPEYGAAGIWDVSCDADKMLISHSGTHDISVIDYAAFINKFEQTDKKEELSYDLRFFTDIRYRLKVVGNGPRSLLLDGEQAVVPTYFSDTLNVIDLVSRQIYTHALNPNLKETIERRGERIFNDASHCFQGWQSCNGCHPGDARSDGMNWDLLNDGIGNPKNCKSLLYAHQTAPAMISGIRPDAETAVRAGFKHIQFAEIGEEDAKAVDAYLNSLRPLPSPYLEQGNLSEKAKRGKKVFQKASCNYCHSGPLYTDMQMHKIGSFEFEKGWDTPTLKEVWRTAPYLFDGRAESIEILLKDFKHGLERQKLKKKEMEDLIEYVKSL
ncbi:c-type cytochrome [Carboxylicivirga sediminis]|uniref:C-type cytochrome n=1 Tax=Carboxylicivirga sediminis TaxID=2006564 RepID=A0A941F298_9BACT|nr:YncE family protein [Carboxylicivirga sediminis]MBR8535037.1 c-type cytochrome [Carboxylicivirga sediminis]